MPVFRLKETFDVARALKASLNRKRIKSRKQKIFKLKREIFQLKWEFRGAKEQAERIKHKKNIKGKRQKIFQLEREIRAAKEQAEGISDGQLAPQVAGKSQTGALPDFVIIGAKKCGTTSFYDLLTQHPHVEPAALKASHYFDDYFDEGIEWYRRCFPPPTWKDGRRSITGEATPEYLLHPLVPERMVKVLPQVRLIVLLRNPVDRAYSDYQQQVIRQRRETRTFEEAIEAEERRLFGKEGKASEHEEGVSFDDVLYTKYLYRGIYVDQLPRWSRFFDDAQMLVLKSENFYEHTLDTLKVGLNFLDLPDWEPEAWKIRNKGKYEQKMNPVTRRRLEDFFEPYNRRLYEYIGVDFGW